VSWLKGTPLAAERNTIRGIFTQGMAHPKFYREAHDDPYRQICIPMRVVFFAARHLRRDAIYKMFLESDHPWVRS
jgi:hypothetical protein